MEDSLIVERAELLSSIEQLEVVVGRLQDVNAGVSGQLTEQLQQVRADVERVRLPSKWETARKMTFELLKTVAAEVIKAWIETLICTSAALRAWFKSYGRRVHQGPQRYGWPDAT